jgi:mannose-6-phosphate isomerase-like protein (cupin superfamily)
MQKIIKSGSKSEKYIEENCFITEILNTKEYPDMSIAQARVKPGITTVLHWLKETEEKYFILSGSGEVEIDGEIAGTVQAGDLVLIPNNSTQRIKNTGAEDLIFICICTPRFETKNYNTA